MNGHDCALRVLRTYRRLTQQQLAERATVSKATISAYETGKQQIGATSLGLVLEALELPFRAWCDAVGFVGQLDRLSKRSGRLRRIPPELEPLQREAEALAQSMGWAQERQVAAVLELALEMLTVSGERHHT